MHYQPQRHLLKDRIILVTGASDGIGREAALTYARYSASSDSAWAATTKNCVSRRPGRLNARDWHSRHSWFTLDLLTCTSAGVPAAGAAA